MKSNELAKLAGVTVRTLRHYHAIGLLDEPPRQANGYRDYRPEDLLRVLRIRQLASLGFPLDQVAGMLDELDAERSQREPRLPADQPTADDILAERAPAAPASCHRPSAYPKPCRGFSGARRRGARCDGSPRPRRGRARLYGPRPQ